VDVNLPGNDLLEATRQILAASDTVVAPLLSNNEEDEYSPKAAECGASSYIPKASFGPDLLEGVWKEVGPS
jgi:DNA-binding NarL/FixJ family response regulator